MTFRRLSCLTVTLAPAAAGPAWRFTRAEGPDPAQVLVGRTPQEAAQLAPRIFNLCGAAHGLAAARALGCEAMAEDRADAAALARETVRDHALAILADWPQIMGEAPERDTIAAVVAAGAATATARRLLLGTDCDPASFTPAELEALLQEAPTTTLRRLARIRREAQPTEGCAALPELGAEVIAARIGAEMAWPPSQTAGWPQAHETGALGRVSATPLIAALVAAEGRSLFVRLLARLLDLLAALDGRIAGTARAPAPGIGLAPAARGLLGHGARVESGRVAAYRVLSPSAWNLAAGGLIERAFSALSIGPRTDMLARLLICAINPCVPVVLQLDAPAALRPRAPAEAL